MMGHHERLAGYWESEMLTRGGKRVNRWRSGTRPAIKRKFNKRVRQAERRAVRKEMKAEECNNG